MLPCAGQSHAVAAVFSAFSELFCDAAAYDVGQNISVEG